MYNLHFARAADCSGRRDRFRRGIGCPRHLPRGQAVAIGEPGIQAPRSGVVHRPDRSVVRSKRSFRGAPMRAYGRVFDAFTLGAFLRCSSGLAVAEGEGQHLEMSQPPDEDQDRRGT